MAKTSHSKTAKNGRNGSGPQRRSLFRRLITWFVLIIVLLVGLPYLLIPLYALPQIHPVSTLMLAENAAGRSYERQWVSFDAIAPVLVQSVMMSEDGQFCTHSGVDWKALNLVIDDALDGEATRGASTIPMQTAKNLFLPSTRSVLRKALEIPLALWIDVVWSKRRLMEIYLNIAEWAPGVYGIEAAAQAYFGVSAAKLSARQAARLAVTLPNPIKRNAANPSRSMQKLARVIEGRAKQSGAYIKCLYD
ncbi:monofunctional biosynthetic peptidoglycan transglycosylase [Hoeflea sp. G2-23]|uniref:Biosynthetic peptidoglycan transglycosylase n=1 Tax=Hoeflea algicola TaxID=2983763 RepID=A0ABT3ZAK2_9HYPH|nr:monofunctional biosynthetic peptidoglycan transglycosylase [Hoeflea algicola]MCY0148787.1 monofunctional biosynthetic peptidoglycan transglycosylase [Hoeflea algicola]